MRLRLLDELSAAAGAGLGEPWKARARENPVEAMEKLRERMLVAIQDTEGFHII